MFYEDEDIKDNYILEQIDELSEKFNKKYLKDKVKTLINKLRKAIQIGIEKNTLELSHGLNSIEYTTFELIKMIMVSFK